MIMKEITINNVQIGLTRKPYIVAELSANHNGDLQRALDTISAAKDAGADAVKIQTYTADTMTIDSHQDDFKINGGLWNGYTLYDLYKKAHTPYEWHHALFEHAKNEEITIFSTPFDETAVDLLEELNAPAYKIASFEVVDLPLIRYVAKQGKPMIISTGMANFDEITAAVNAAIEEGARDLVLLHCISAYPAPLEQANLKTIVDMKEKFNVLTGLSDHTMNNNVPILSVALGACMIEKHFTLSRQDPGPDSEFSLEPNELKNLCQDTYKAWQALGEAGYDLKEAEISSLAFRRSIYVVKDIRQGEQFTSKNIRRIRPGYGLPPSAYNSILGKYASRDIARGTALTKEFIS